MKQKILLLTMLSIILAGCSSKEETKGKDTFKDAFRNSVKTVQVELSNQNKELILTGKVEYNPDKVINYVPLVSGVVTRTYFSLGDKVKKGQTLLEIRSTDLSELQSNQSSFQDDIEIAKRDLQSAQSMFDDNMLSEKELLEAKSKLRQAETALHKTQNDMTVFGRNKGNGVFAISAPMDGFIVGKSVSSGSTVSSDGDILFTVADLNSVWINANVYATNLQFVKEGMNVNISLLSYPNEVFSGKISHLSQVFDSEEKVLKARIEMPNKDMKFKPEMSAVIRLTDYTQQQYLSIPSDALIFDADKYFVVLRVDGDQFSVKEVKLQGHHDKTSYIATGLAEGQEVVVKNQLLIYSELKES